MGRELFDYAFKMYATRWMFKHPTPADFFRTMEDASGVDLDWFWRGWFYTKDHVDISLDKVNWFLLDTKDPVKEKAFLKDIKNESLESGFIGDQRNKESIAETVTEKYPELNDFYNTYDPLEATVLDKEDYQKYLSKLTDEEKQLLESGYNYYQLDFSNVGGLVMPIILEFGFEDGSNEIIRIPAEIWKRNTEKVSKMFFFVKEVVSVSMDPFLETADVNLNNNFWPARMVPSKFKAFKEGQVQRKPRENPMQRSQRK